MLLISASSSADCVMLVSNSSAPYTDRTADLPSKSLKLLPILGVPSLALFPDVPDRRVSRVCIAVPRGLVPSGSCDRRRSSLSGRLTGTPELAELVDDSPGWGFVAVLAWVSCVRRRAPGPRRSVAFKSAGCLDSPGWESGFSGRKAGESSSSSSSSCRVGRDVEYFPKRLKLGVFLVLGASSSSEEELGSDELDSASSSSVGDLCSGRPWSRLLADSRRP